MPRVVARPASGGRRPRWRRAPRRSRRRSTPAAGRCGPRSSGGRPRWRPHRPRVRPSRRPRRRPGRPRGRCPRCRAGPGRDRSPSPSAARPSADPTGGRGHDASRTVLPTWTWSPGRSTVGPVRRAPLT